MSKFLQGTGEDIYFNNKDLEYISNTLGYYLKHKRKKSKHKNVK